MRQAPEDAHMDEQDSQQDDDEWRNGRVGDREHDSFEDWDEGGGPRTPSNHSNSRGKESHRSASLCDRDAVWAQIVTTGRVCKRQTDLIVS